MILEKHISTLLFSHDCVVIPEFGAFITQKVNAAFRQEDAVFSPPAKQLAFNPALVKNDGLLIQQVAQFEHLSFEKAKEEVENAVQFWKNHLDNNSQLNLEGIGTLSKNADASLSFIPVQNNFLLSSFGLKEVKATYILPAGTHQGSGTTWWKVASVIPILLGGYLYFGKPKPVTDFVNEQWSGFVSPILNPSAGAESVKRSVIGSVEENTAGKYIVKDFTVYDYQVIAGAFRVKSEAETLEKELQSQGYEFAKLTQKKGSYYYVAFKTFPTKEEALMFRKEVHEEFPQTWVLSLKE